MGDSLCPFNHMSSGFRWGLRLSSSVSPTSQLPRPDRDWVLELCWLPPSLTCPVQHWNRGLAGPPTNPMETKEKLHKQSMSTVRGGKGGYLGSGMLRGTEWNGVACRTPVALVMATSHFTLKRRPAQLKPGQLFSHPFTSDTLQL